MIARALDDGHRPRVPHAEALAHTARDEELAAGGAVRDGVARQHGLRCAVGGEWFDRDHAAAHALGDVVLGLAFEGELDAVLEKGAEALPGAAAEVAAVARRERRAHGAA